MSLIFTNERSERLFRDAMAEGPRFVRPPRPIDGPLVPTPRRVFSPGEEAQKREHAKALRRARDAAAKGSRPPLPPAIFSHPTRKATTSFGILRETVRRVRQSLPSRIRKIRPLRRAICRTLIESRMPWAVLETQTRRAKVVRPRQEVMFLMHKLGPGWPLVEIGKFLGGRDYSTVLHGIRAHAARKGIVL